MSEVNENVVVVGDWLLFPNGTMRENSTIKSAVTKKPADAHEKCRLQVLFWQKKLELSVAEFDDKKATLLGNVKHRLTQDRNPGGCPMETTEAVGLLNTLKSKVQHCQDMLAEAEENLEEVTPPQLTKTRDIAEQNRQRLGDFVSAIENIEI